MALDIIGESVLALADFFFEPVAYILWGDWIHNRAMKYFFRGAVLLSSACLLGYCVYFFLYLES
jgi:hypothetical protein